MHYALISFLNARPLWWGLVHGERREGETFEFTSPARCADLIADGRADLGLIPAIELIRIPEVVAIPEICIASESEVRSVLLVSKVPIEEIRSVGLDPASRTSVALARILLGERLGADARIRFDVVETKRLLDLEGHDAAVVIGDRALQVSRRGEWRFRYDLVSEWRALFGEPFVFAVWAGRRDRVESADPRELLRILRESRDHGIDRIDLIAREASEELAVPYDELVEYFRTALHYGLGEAERKALSHFLDLSVRHGLADDFEAIRWLDVEPRSSGLE